MSAFIRAYIKIYLQYSCLGYSRAVTDNSIYFHMIYDRTAKVKASELPWWNVSLSLMAAFIFLKTELFVVPFFCHPWGRLPVNRLHSHTCQFAALAEKLQRVDVPSVRTLSPLLLFLLVKDQYVLLFVSKPPYLCYISTV